MRMRRPALWWSLLLAGWCAVVWWLSGKSRPDDVVGFAMELPDWLLHGVEYAAGGFLAFGAFKPLANPPSRARRVLAAAVAFCLLHGIVDEWHQSFVPGRDPSPIDVTADVIGGTMGALVHQWLAGHAGRPDERP